MFKNFLKVALRNLRRDKIFTAINVLGLAIGLATCLLICMYVTDELRYDRYNKHFDDIYRVDADINFGGAQAYLATVPDAMGPVLKKDYPDVLQYTRFVKAGNMLFKKGDQNVNESRGALADSTIFDVFSLQMLQGDPSKALTDPTSIVITASMAKAYFNSLNVVGKSMIINDSNYYKVTGVIADMPSQSHFNFDYLLALSAQEGSRRNNWFGNDFNTYVLLRKGTSPKKFDARFDAIVHNYLGVQIQQMLHQTLEALQQQGNHIRYTLTPLSQIHLHSNKMGELGPNSDVVYVYIFSAIAIVIILLACVNFTNLATARSANRAKEVGIRKVLGSMRKNLIVQFMMESILLTLVSLLIAIGLAIVFLPYINRLAGKQMTLGMLVDPDVIVAMLLALILVGVLAGSYPALFLSSFKPINVLKGKIATGFRIGWLRSSLVTFQFVISVTLITGTVVIFSQLHYIQNKDLGFDRNEVLVIHNSESLGNNAKVLKDQLSTLAAVKSATMTGYLPTEDDRRENSLFKDAAMDPSGAVHMQTWPIDSNYIETLGMHVIKGRNFSARYPTDSNGIVLNETAVKMFGFDDPIGKKIYTRNPSNNAVQNFTIVGVIRDFNFSSLRNSITPVGLLLQDDPGCISLRVSTGNVSGLIRQIESDWKALAPNTPFSYTFMNEEFERQYSSELRIEQLFISFAVLALFIACLGLFGLSAFAAQQRMKEIGIRKVLGASVNNIMRILSVDFMKLVVLSIVVATPVAWLIMNKWLQNFAYRISMSAWFLIMAGGVAILVAFLAVSMQVFKIAAQSPITGLRSE